MDCGRGEGEGSSEVLAAREEGRTKVLDALPHDQAGVRDEMSGRRSWRRGKVVVGRDWDGRASSLQRSPRGNRGWEDVRGGGGLGDV